MVFTFCLVFLSTIGLSDTTFLQDPRIASNPGPTPKNPINYNSEREQELFNKIRDTDYDIVNASCHNYFLKFCEDLNLLPRGFDHQTALATFKPNEGIRAQIQMLDNLAGLDKIRAHISHYNNVIVDLVQKRTLEFSALTATCSKDRLDYFSDILNNKIKHDTNTLLKQKERKLNSLVDINIGAHENSWIRELHLTDREKKFISDNERICDSIINASMRLLNKSKPYMHFQSSSVPAIFLEYSPLETVHIHHNNSNHFVTSSSIGNKVRIYDSLNTTPTKELIDQITKLYSPDPSVTPTIHKSNIQFEQSGGTDCGVYAIAYATDRVYMTRT